ncbi:MAG TPA: PilZ domain-containing protein [Rubrivivax sp.]|nr:PilZ domain-containing protein [Rubrivivax sp.]
MNPQAAPATTQARRRSSPLGHLRRQVRVGTRVALSSLPERLRFALFRRLVDCELPRETDFELKIAETQSELEACFGLLHDAYVASGFMRPQPSGLRATPYHALPTTTTLCAKVGPRVVGTLSIVREGVFGFPMQTAFDISAVRAKEGRIAEISALAVHPDYRKTGGAILFPLMKFMYEYCTRYFDTRHLVIAVHPSKIELYESLLFFQRLPAQVVDSYDFANGAPAVGAALDLHEAPALFEQAYSRKPHRRNLHRFFVETRMPQIRFPVRPWHTSNDPILTPAIADYFFNQRTQGFSGLDSHRRQLLHSIYRSPDWASVLPALDPGGDEAASLRRYPRYSMNCPAELTTENSGAVSQVTIVELSAHGFQARCTKVLALGSRFQVSAELGTGLLARVNAELVREVPGDTGRLFGFHVEQPDEAWLHCVSWLESA